MDMQSFETHIATILKTYEPLQYHSKMMTSEIAAAADGLLPAFITSTNKILEHLQLPVMTWEQSYGQDAALGTQVLAVKCQSFSLFLAAFCSLLRKQQHGHVLMIDDIIATFMIAQSVSSMKISSTLSRGEDTPYAYH